MFNSDPFDKKKSLYSDNDIAHHDENILGEKTMVFYGEEKTTEILVKTFSNAKTMWNVYANSNGPTITMGVDAIRKGTIALNSRGCKNSIYY